MKRNIVFNATIFILFAAIFVSGCGSENNKTSFGTNIIQKGSLSFSENDIFNIETVKEAREKSSEAEKATSSAQIAAGKAAFEANDLDKSADALLNAILLYPAPEAYWAYSRTHLAIGNLEKALNAAQLADTLGYPDKASLFFAKASIYVQLGDFAATEAVLRQGLAGKIIDRQHFVTDAALDPVRGTAPYMTVLAEFFKPDDQTVADVFLSSFPKKGREFQIEANFLNDTAAAWKPMAEFFEKNVPEISAARYGDEEASTLFFVAHLGKTDDFHLVVYGGKPRTMVGFAPTFYYLATYNNAGKLVNKLLFAAKETWDEVYFGKTTTDGKIIVERQRVQLDTKDQTPRNKIVSSEIIDHQEFIINEKGEFVKL